MAYTRYVGPETGGPVGERVLTKDTPAERGNQPAGGMAESPLSFGQLRLWFLDQLEPGSAMYNMPMALRLKGHLDAPALGRALNAVVERHSSLRTRFVCSGEYPEQVVDEKVTVELPIIDLGGEVETERENKALKLVQEEINRPFNLSSDLLLRVKLLRLAEEHHLLVVTMHHIVSDEWSLRIFFRELGERYSGFSEGKEVTLPPTPAQYADFAVWQRNRVTGELLQKQLDFWKDRLADDTGVFEIPTDHGRGPVPSFRGTFVTRVMSEKLIQGCKELAKRHRVTGFMVHLAAFYALLYRCARRGDITVGCPIAGRNELETEGVMGFFVNTLLLRTRVDDDPDFAGLLKRVRELTLDALEHQEMPIEKLIEELHPERSLNHLPFTRVMFAVQNELFDRTRWGRLEVEFLDVATDTAKFDLTLLVQEGAKGAVARAEYNTDLFEAATIERFLEHYENLLTDAVTNPHKHLSQLALLGEKETSQVLVEWNATRTNYPRAKCVHQVFEEEVERSGKAVAVEFGDVSLTYGELNGRANQLARYLAQFKIGPDTPVAICVERSADMIVAMLGVLKAGGAYVPLDPEYPAERLEYMLRDTQSPILLTQQLLLPRLPEGCPKPICLDADWELIGRESRANLGLPAMPEQLAYVMYTSGSTGTPKGVAVPHRGVTRLVLNTNYVEFKKNDRIAQVSNASFDAATLEVWGALLNGGRLVGFDSDVILSPSDFARELREEKISAMFLTAALFNQMAAEEPDAFGGVDTLIVGGEALDPKWIRKVLRHNPPRRLLNGYGPTENTTFTCCHLIGKLDEDQTNIPIGRPISNTRVYILDQNLSPVPIGVPGELYAGGDGLARGYWKQPDLTAERFVPNPFAEAGTKELLYKTGDLARFLPNGDVEYLGRLDNQVKVRGFRIELGEIEATLRRHPGVNDCAVKVFGTGAENKRLVAYCAGDGEQAPNVSELRSFLRRTLPDHMLPSAFVALPSLPLTPNGKVDRNALPEPDQARPSLEKVYAAPRDGIESRLAAIWERVLGVTPIGIQDKFFELGGHSLLAVRLVAAIEKEFGRKLRLSTVFQAPTIQDLAAVLRDEVKESSVTGSTSIVEIQARGSRKPLFFVHGAGGGMFWGYMNLSRHLGTDQPVYAFRSRGLAGREEFEQVEEMAREYVKDLQVVQPAGPYYIGGYCFGGNVAYEMARQLVAQGEEVAMLALLNCSPPNSNYTKIRVGPAWTLRFAKNLIYWGDYFRQWTPAQRRAFFRWKWEQAKKRLRGFTDAFTGSIREVDVGDLVDLSSFTVEERRVWESHIRALLKYQPQPLAGRVHLFRSPGHPLWCSFDADYGWGSLARDGVEITIVPGAHEKILEEPCVETVAADLDRMLAKQNHQRLTQPNGNSSTAKTRSEKARTQDPDVSNEAVAAKSGNPDATANEVRNGEAAPLSFFQQRIWLLNQLEPGHPAYNLVSSAKLEGPLNVKALTQTLNEILRRQEILRTTFTAGKTTPAQTVQAMKPVSLEPADLSGVPVASREAEVARLAMEEKNLPFDLARDLLFRVRLVRFSDREHALIIASHEIACDQASLEIILNEIRLLYASFCSGDSSRPKSPAMQYSRYAASQREQRPRGEWDAHIAFWKKQLHGAPALLELPADYPRPAAQSYRAGTDKIQISKEIAGRVRELSRELGMDEGVVFFAALTVLLQRYTRQDDIPVCIRTSARDEVETRNLAGNFENLMVLRTSLEGDPQFAELAQRVEAVWAEGLRNRKLPFQKILDELRPARDQSYHPLAQVLFNYRKDSNTVTEAAGLKISALGLPQGTTKFDLELQVCDDGPDFTAQIDYAADLFEPRTVRRILEHFETLIGGIVDNPKQRVSELRVLTSEEKRILLTDWTATQKEYPREKTLADLFEEQVARTPGAEAVVCGDVRLTYSELYERAGAVAAQLKALGVKQEDLVGICVERSWEMLAAILGTLLSGAAYVPMDPSYPKDRLGFMLEDADIKVLLTQKKLLGTLSGVKSTTLCVEDINWGQAPADADSTGRHIAPRGTADSLAYVIYTSGSTGRPKGVALEHRSAVAFVYWAKDVFTPEELSGVLASTSICFDLSVFEMFVPLSLGGRVILAENALALPSLPAANEVRLINTVPSAARELVRVKGIPASVRVINLAGEPLATSLVDALYEQTSVSKVYDLYGPTETTTYSTFTLRQPGKRATIGRPLANEQVYLLDPRMQPVPIGVVGELYIGGDGLARGYLNRPEMTAERFIPDPFKAGGRLYKTGDLARWRSDGNLEFLGRIDNQVKVRGFRIELGEIEAALRKQEGVTEAVVLAREDQPGQKRLVAYVAGAKDGTPTSDELRSAIRKALPEYMTPSAFVFLEALPLTPNGKADRKALPAPDLDSLGDASELIAPRTSTEEQVAAAWREVLQLKEIGVKQNFFDLGGDSLQAIQVISRIQEQFNINLPLSSLFDASTVESLAAGIESSRWGARKGSQTLLKPVSRKDRLPVSFVQERLWFFAQLLPDSHAYNVPAAWRLKGALNREALEKAINQIVRRHEALRTVFKYDQGMLSQVIAPELTIPIQFEDLEPLPASERETRARQLCNTEAAWHFDLSRGPLIRVCVARLDQEEHLLMVVMHHSVSDGWSLGVFAHELGIIYRALVAGEALPKLPELPVQYADFAAWQRKNMDGEMLKAESAFWKQKLAGAPAALELPTDHVERSEQSLKAGVSTLQINAGLSSALGQFSQAEGSTPFHSLMAALVMTLHKWTSQRDIVIGTVVAGRNRKEIENVIGCFMNFLPVRVKLSEEETANEVLGAVRTAVVEAQNHQDYPFEKMVEAINPERHLNRNPLYNVALLFQNYPMPRFESEGLTGNPLPAPLDEALLDLRFEAEQNESGLSVSCDYKADLFEPATIERLLGCFEQTLQSLVQEPGKKMRDLAGMTNASPGLRRDGEKLAKIAIASTFTAEPIADPLRYWLRELEIPAEVEFALFNQVFQELLDPSSLLMSNRDGLNVMLLRLEDWQHAGKREHKTTGEKARKEFEDESLERTVKDFALALRNAAAQGGTSWLVCLCPSSPTADLAQSERYERMEKKLADELEGLSGVYLLTSAELAHWYPVKDYYDVRGDELGHIPYTPLFFTALATGVARKYHALKRPVYKVIALDCDNTLWAGVCGEDGPKGIRLDAAFLALQKFIRAQQEAGVLLCACSKNNEADVREVFEQRQEMPLRAEHFAAWRLNWHPKSANLKSLAEELKLGLDSFIFVDDNPLECADVEANCPEVLTLQLPEDPAMIPQFLEHCWAFDHLKLTVEDRKRAEMYRQNKEREQLRTQSLSLGDFLAGLELRIAIEPMAEGQLPRVSQLTQRTNQFNFTTRRRSESDLRMLAGSAEVLTVSVSDRFGDYGLAGLVMFSVRNGALDVETFLLSCRVLGRGVEHRMLAHLGEVAHQRKLNWVDVHFSNSGRNRPGLEFLENVGAPFRQAQNGGYLFRFPTGFAAEVTFNPQSSEARAAETIKKPESGGDHNASVENNGARANRPEPLLSKLTRCREIALNLNDPEKIYQAMEAKSVKRQGKRAGYVPPQNDLERSLCGIWQKLLRIEKVGVHDNFFELGGHSLLAVRLFTEIETAVGRKLPLVTLFQSPTVRQLARVLDRGDAAAPHSLLVPLQPLGSKPPLFLVHGAGGDVLWGYANLTAHLAPDQPVYGIKSKGQAGQEEFSRIEDMAACYLKQIKAHQPQGPYFLGGYCFGGNVAFEMARQLGLHGEAVALVALLDSAPSNAGYEKVAWWRPDYAFRFARNATHWLRDFSELKSEDRRKFVTRKLSALGRKLRRRFGAARGSRTVDLEDIIDPTHFPENELKLWQIHLQALNAHIERPFEGKVLLLRTRGQPLFCSLEQDFRWGTLARAGVKVVITPGSHENIFMEPNVEALATHLQSALTEAQTS